MFVKNEQFNFRKLWSMHVIHHMNYNGVIRVKLEVESEGLLRI